jgi:hypothetical protein
MALGAFTQRPCPYTVGVPRLEGVLMDSPRLSRDLLAFLIGVPLAWAVLLMFHPGGEARTSTDPRATT